MVVTGSSLDTTASKKATSEEERKIDRCVEEEDFDSDFDSEASKKFWFQENEESSEDEDEEEKLNRCVQEEARDRFVKVDYMTQYFQENPDVVQSRQKREEIISAGVKVWDNMSESEKAPYVDEAEKMFAPARVYARGGWMQLCLPHKTYPNS